MRCLVWAAIIATAPGAAAFSPENGADIELDGLSYSVQNADQPWSLANPDTDALRFELRPGDVWSGDAPVKERSEIAGETIYAAGNDITISYVFQIEPGSENTSDWLLIGQLHAADEFSNPVFAIELIGEHLAVHLRHKLPGEPYEDWFAYVDEEPIERGKYYTVEAELHMHDDEEGHVDVWIDGEQVVDYTGHVGYGCGTYWKQGIYRAASPEVMIVEYRKLQIAGEAEAGAEGDTASQPSPCPGASDETTMDTTIDAAGSVGPIAPHSGGELVSYRSDSSAPHREAARLR